MGIFIILRHSSVRALHFIQVARIHEVLRDFACFTGPEWFSIPTQRHPSCIFQTQQLRLFLFSSVLQLTFKTLRTSVSFNLKSLIQLTQSCYILSEYQTTHKPQKLSNHKQSCCFEVRVPFILDFGTRRSAQAHVSVSVLSSLPRKEPRIYRIQNWEAKKIISGAAGNRNMAAHPAANN